MKRYAFLWQELFCRERKVIFDADDKDDHIDIGLTREDSRSLKADSVAHQSRRYRRRHCLAVIPHAPWYRQRKA